MGRHLLDLDSLLNEAIDTLSEQKLVKTKGYRWSAGQGWSGRYFGLCGFQALLHVSHRRWGTEAATPLWLEIFRGDSLEVPALLAGLRRDDRLFDSSSGFVVPIFLSDGADRDAISREIDRQLREVRELLALATPPGDGPVQPTGPEIEADDFG